VIELAGKPPELLQIDLGHLDGQCTLQAIA
jgi:hypothetical protein